MKIIAGSARGRRILSVPKEMPVRPISSRIRQSLFDILRPRIPGSRFLDLFAGTGAVGLEALSRGAQRAVFLDADRKCVAVIEKNLGRAGWLSPAPSAYIPGFSRAIPILEPDMDTTAYGTSLKTSSPLPTSRLGLALHGDALKPLSWIVYRCGLRKFDLIFMGPPYKDKSGRSLRVVSAVAGHVLSAELLDEDGWLIAQHHKSETPESAPGLELFRSSRYGDTSLSFLRRCCPPSPAA